MLGNMSTPQTPGRRRRVARREAGPATPPPSVADPAEAVAAGTVERRRRQRPRRSEEPAPQVEAPAPPVGSRQRGNDPERSLRSLVSTRATQVSPTAAMRAREYGMPTAADLADAELDVVLVRRNYVPPAPLATGRRRPADGDSGPR